jgi:hypothetical protein
MHKFLVFNRLYQIREQPDVDVVFTLINSVDTIFMAFWPQFLIKTGISTLDPYDLLWMIKLSRNSSKGWMGVHRKENAYMTRVMVTVRLFSIVWDELKGSGIMISPTTTFKVESKLRFSTWNSIFLGDELHFFTWGNEAFSVCMYAWPWS